MPLLDILEKHKKLFLISKSFYSYFEVGGFGATLYRGSTAGMSTVSFSIRVSPEGWVDRNSGALLSLFAFSIFCQTLIAPMGL